jgi:6-phospho-3-hexuloisomerase
MSVKDLSTGVLAELGDVLGEVDESAVSALQEKLAAARRVFVAGAGRSGLMMRGFAMRLMHLGLAVHVVGDPTTPSLQAEDILLIGSGSGETGSLQGMARKARQIGAGVALITIVPESTIGKLSDPVIRLDAPSPKAAQPTDGRSPRTSIQPMGSLFEQALLLLLDIVVMRIAAVRGLPPEQMFARHANLE